MRFLTDENFNHTILRELVHLLPDAELVTLQATVVFGADDPTILAWAAQENFIVVTHDVRTMTKYAYERIVAGLPMPGLIEVKEKTPIGQAIEELEYVIKAGQPADFENKVVYIPLN